MVDFSTTIAGALDGLTGLAGHAIDGWRIIGPVAPSGGHALASIPGVEYGHGRFVPASVEFNVPPGAS